jgi:hypothetical protein
LTFSSKYKEKQRRRFGWQRNGDAFRLAAHDARDTPNPGRVFLAIEASNEGRITVKPEITQCPEVELWGNVG